MNRSAFVNQMQQYMPVEACEIGHSWLTQHPVKLKITKPRKTKLGDYRPNQKNGLAQITINGNLNPYSFAITFTHEMAHHFDFKSRKTLAEPHGKSWKIIYQKMLIEMYEAGVFPDKIRHEIVRHINRPKAASCSDSVLLKALRKFDDNQIISLDELPIGSTFALNNNRHFVKGELRRTRYRCQEVGSNKNFLVHGSAEVELIEA